MKIDQTRIDRLRRLHVTGLPGIVHVGKRLRGDVRGHRDGAMATAGKIGKRRRVLAGQLRETVAQRVQDARRAADLGGRVLDPGNVRERRVHANEIGIVDPDDRAAGNVIDDDGDVDRLGDGRQLAVQPFRRRLVVIGADDQHAVGTGIGGMARQAHRLGGGVRAGAGDHRNAAGGLLDAQLDDTVMLVMRQGRRFTGGAYGHEPMRAALDLEFDKFSERILVDPPVAERRDQRGVGSGEGRRGSILRHGTVRSVLVKRPK